MPLIDVAAALESATVTWEDLSWIRQAWSGLVVVKGFLSPTMFAAPWTKVQQRLLCRITAVDNSIAYRLRFKLCLRS